MATQVFLWTAPRCVSTAFERSIMELKDTKIFHEPYSKSYYYGPERQSKRYSANAVDVKASYREIRKLLTKEYDGVDVIFSKDMAYAVENHFGELLQNDLQKFQHTFLIRDPGKAVLSLYKASVNTQLTGWDRFDPVEAGFKQMFDLYQFLKKELNVRPVVIDADDLLSNPAGTMEAYCKEVGIPYNEKMLRWEPGPVPDWDVWNGWHENALKSSGFTKQDPERLKILENLGDYPSEVQASVLECQKYFDFLKKQKVEPLHVEI